MIRRYMWPQIVGGGQRQLGAARVSEGHWRSGNWNFIFSLFFFLSGVKE